MAEQKFNQLVEACKQCLQEPSYLQAVNDKLQANLSTFSDSKRLQILISHNLEKFELDCIQLFNKQLPEVQRLNNIDKLIKLFITAFKGNDKAKQEFMQILQDVIDPDYFLQYTGFIVYGCPLSTDLDVAVITDDLKKLHKPINYQQLRNDLTALSYPEDKELDVVTIFIDGDKIADFSKGGAELHNIIIETFKYHKQMYDECPATGHRPLEIVDMIRAISKFIIDNFKFMLPADYYQRVRDQKIKAYAGEWSRVNFVNQHCEFIVINTDSLKHKSVYKSLVMKLCQLLLAEEGKYEYTKQGLADKFGAGCAWFLTRGKQGQEYLAKSSLFILLDEFKRLSIEHKPVDMEWYNLPVNLHRNPTELDNELYQEFIKSPENCTDRFSKVFMQNNPDRYEGVIGSAFKIRSHNTNLLPLQLKELVYDCDQRSEEWQKLLKYHKCGRNNGIEPYDGDEWVKFYYNLIRGCIGELMVIKNADFSVVAKDCRVDRIVVGMMVDEKVEGSMGISPDLLLKINQGIIPVEIKCVMYPPSDNAEMRSRLKMAKLELQSSAKILKVNRGIIAMLHIYQVDNEWVYDSRYCWVEV